MKLNNLRHHFLFVSASIRSVVAMMTFVRGNEDTAGLYLIFNNTFTPFVPRPSRKASKASQNTKTSMGRLVLSYRGSDRYPVKLGSHKLFGTVDFWSKAIHFSSNADDCVTGLTASS